jgi:ATP-dependent helicase/nuclease subunit B
MSDLRLFTIPPGVPFLPTLADAVVSGRLVPGFPASSDPLALAGAVIYVPTRRAARALRAVFANRSGAKAAILPSIRPLGEFEEDLGWFDENAPDGRDPPIDAMERLLRLAPLVRAWEERLPGHLAARYDEGVVVPATMADALWLAADLARLIDAVETQGASWSRFAGIAVGRLSAWWEVTLDFLKIVTEAWPDYLEQRQLSNPAAWRDAALRAEAKRLRDNPPVGPIIAAGSTGSIPATAELLREIAKFGQGAVVLPGFDTEMDPASRLALSSGASDPTVHGHPQYGMNGLLQRIGALPHDVRGLAEAPSALRNRAGLVAAALRPATATQSWPEARHALGTESIAVALADVALVEAGNEREEALAIAVALREAIETPGSEAALVTPDRALARRVSAELLRFNIHADDSGGTPLSATPPGTLLMLLLDTVFRPGDPVPIAALLKHPLLRCGVSRGRARAAAEALDLVTLRGGVGRPDIAQFDRETERRLAAAAESERPPFWLERLGADEIAEARRLAAALVAAVTPLARWRDERELALTALSGDLARALEALTAGSDGDLAPLYDGDAGEALAGFLRSLVGSQADLDFAPDETPGVIAALLGGVTVKPRTAGSARVHIWGALEARLQTVDTLVIGGLNEGTWPRQPDPGRFLSRLMMAELALEPPERQIGQSAHDFVMAAGAPRLVLTRSTRAGGAPAVASRWIERLVAFAGNEAMEPVRGRGARYLALAARLDESDRVAFAERPKPAPPTAVRPRRFSVTEIETLRRDPYAIYARRILRLQALEPLLRDPGATERGLLMHDALARFVESGAAPDAPSALETLLGAGRAVFDEAALPPDVEAVWWPRFARTASCYLDWENGRATAVTRRHAEVSARPTLVDTTGVTLSGRADRIDIRIDGAAEIIDFKTGATPSKVQAHTLVSPQLALEAALFRRGAFDDVGKAEPADLLYVRLKPDGSVVAESVLTVGRGTSASSKTAPEIAVEAWRRLAELLQWFADEQNGYRSRILPFREGDVEGDYDHLARVLEWSAGGDSSDGEGTP